MEPMLARALYTNFLEFVGSRDDAGRNNGLYLDDDAWWLTHYIKVWLEEGDAVIIANGDFGTYLRGIIQILREWCREKSICDFMGAPNKAPFKREVGEPMLRSDDPDKSPIFDPDHFRELCVRRGVRPTLSW